MLGTYEIRYECDKIRSIDLETKLVKQKMNLNKIEEDKMQ